MNFNYQYITTSSAPSNNRFLYKNNFNLLKNFGNPTEPIPSSWPYICEPLPEPEPAPEPIIQGFNLFNFVTLTEPNTIVEPLSGYIYPVLNTSRYKTVVNYNVEPVKSTSLKTASIYDTIGTSDKFYTFRSEYYNTEPEVRYNQPYFISSHNEPEDDNYLKNNITIDPYYPGFIIQPPSSDLSFPTSINYKINTNRYEKLGTAGRSRIEVKGYLSSEPEINGTLSIDELSKYNFKGRFDASNLLPASLNFGDTTLSLNPQNFFLFTFAQYKSSSKECEFQIYPSDEPSISTSGATDLHFAIEPVSNFYLRITSTTGDSWISNTSFPLSDFSYNFGVEPNGNVKFELGDNVASIDFWHNNGTGNIPVLDDSETYAIKSGIYSQLNSINNPNVELNLKYYKQHISYIEESSEVLSNNINLINQSEDYSENINQSIQEVKTIIDDIIIKSNRELEYNIPIYTYSQEGTTLGYAIPSQEKIYLNMYYYTYTRDLNGSSYSITTVVLLHELLHILGIYDRYHNYNIPDPEDPINRRLWVGPQGIEGYKLLLINNGFATLAHYIDCIPLEDDGGPGTIHVHSEENETYYRNGIAYPALQNEIMTGSLDQNNFITPLSTGVLMDLGFTINENSKYIIF